MAFDRRGVFSSGRRSGKRFVFQANSQYTGLERQAVCEYNPADRRYPVVRKRVGPDLYRHPFLVAACVPVNAFYIRADTFSIWLINAFIPVFDKAQGASYSDFYPVPPAEVENNACLYRGSHRLFFSHYPAAAWKNRSAAACRYKDPECSP